MSYPDQTFRRLVATLALTSALLASTLTAQQAPAPAVTPESEEDTVKLDRFVVTGTNIKRLDQEKTLPVTVIDRDAMEARDASQASDLLAALPQVTGMPGNETATLGATARGDNATISLRGIPSSNTLVLLNGRRLAPHPISQSEAGVPTLSTNVNQLPNRGLERIDVLRDGASSIYGTDAVAGVINYITNRDFRGTELQLRFGETRYGDGQEYRATLTHGFDFAEGKGRVMFTADYFDRAAMYARDRSFSAEADNSYRAPEPWNVSTNTTFNLRSATTQFGNYLLGSITATDAFGNVTGFTGARPTGVPATLAATSGVFFLAPNGAGGVQFLTATPSRTGATHDYYWNNNDYRVIQPQSQRTTIFTSGEYDLTPKVTLFTDLSVYRADSLTYREPDGITQSTDGFIIVPATNPWNPFGTRFWSPTGAPNADGTPRLTGTPSAVSITNKRLSDLMDRTATVTNTVYRGVAGARGKLFDTWSWETAALYSQAKVSDDEEGPSRKSKLIAAINQTDPALAFNPFTRTFAVQNGTLAVTGDYVNPESVQSTFRSQFVREGITKLSSGDVRASGELLPIWGGNSIGAAFGGEFRYEAYDDMRPAFAGLNPVGSGLDPSTNDFLGFSPNSDTHGTRHVTAAYAELVLPLVGNQFKLPLVHTLEVSASARYENYSDFGNTTKPKFGVNWRPLPWAMVRASYNEGFHAPNLAQLFTGTLIRTVTGSTDTYRSAVTGLPTDGPSNRRSVASGNPSLQPEESKGKSAGIVIEVPKVKGLSVGVDYWEIAQSNVIAASGSIADDTQALNAATQAALAAGQAIGSIDLGSGTANYAGDGSVVRLAVTQADRDAFALYNSTRTPGNQRAVVGAIDILRTTYFNRSSEFVNGMDFDLTYKFPKLPIGNFTFNTVWTKLIDFHAYNSAGAARTELLWGNSANVGGATPKWRGTASLTWRRKAWGAGISAFYIGDYSDAGATTTQSITEGLGNPDYIVPVFTNGSTVYRYRVQDSISYNANVSYRIRSKNKWTNDTTIRLGVVNLFDKEPPLSSDSRGYDPAIYNLMARGLSWSVQLTKKL
ncbi:TonB-dependent receptor domain-containing protein [Oleiharenicola lentus]|uniref:TonB-dependent receptor domain-containing protein n=1 Tax=Oleiharenicola lentus TaxID=2508720 RepID=UPI003F672F6B